MSELLLHLVIPFAVVSYFRGWKIALLASAAALLPDLDALLFVHRSMTHSIVVVGLASAILLISIRFLNRAYLGLGFSVVSGLVSHLALDLFTAYTPILWPVVQDSFKLSFAGSVRISSVPSLSFSAGVRSASTTFYVFDALDGPIFTSEGLVVASILFFGAILSHIRRSMIRSPLS